MHVGRPLRRQEKSGTSDNCGRHPQRDCQLTPFTPRHEPQQPDAGRHLGEEHEGPCGRVPEAEHDRDCQEDMYVAVGQIDGYCGKRQHSEEVSASKPRHGREQQRVPTASEYDPWQLREGVEQRCDRRRVVERPVNVGGRDVEPTEIHPPVGERINGEGSLSWSRDEDQIGAEDEPGEDSTVTQCSAARCPKLSDSASHASSLSTD